MTTSLLEKAVQLGVQIWSLAKTLAWLAKFRAKYGPHSHLRSSDSARSKSSQRTTRPLTAPCIKLESTAATTRPIFAELKAWPSLHFDGRPGSSPFSVPSSRQRNKKLAKRLDLQLEPSQSVRRKEETAAAKVKKTGGFCEICNTSFSSLEAHLVTELHAGFVNSNDNWQEVLTSLHLLHLLQLMHLNFLHLNLLHLHLQPLHPLFQVDQCVLGDMSSGQL